MSVRIGNEKDLSETEEAARGFMSGETQGKLVTQALWGVASWKERGCGSPGGWQAAVWVEAGIACWCIQLTAGAKPLSHASLHVLLRSADVHKLLLVVGKITEFTPKQATNPKPRYQTYLKKKAF